MHIRVVRAGQTIELVTAHLKSKLLSFPRPGGSSFTPRDETERSQVAGIALHRRTAEAVTVRMGVNALLANAPEDRLQEDSRDWDQVHWLTWPSIHWRLVGLLDGRRRTLGLGLILPGTWVPETLTLWSPLPPPALPRVRFLKVGKLRLNLRGQELSYV